MARSFFGTRNRVVARWPSELAREKTGCPTGIAPQIRQTVLRGRSPTGPVRQKLHNGPLAPVRASPGLNALLKSDHAQWAGIRPSHPRQAPSEGSTPVGGRIVVQARSSSRPPRLTSRTGHIASDRRYAPGLRLLGEPRPERTVPGECTREERKRTPSANPVRLRLRSTGTGSRIPVCRSRCPDTGHCEIPCSTILPPTGVDPGTRSATATSKQ